MIDIGPCEVRGSCKASRARVFWKDGMLYVMKNVNDVRKFPTALPTLVANKYVAMGDGIEIKFFRRGCSCSYTLKRFPIADMIAKAR